MRSEVAAGSARPFRIALIGLPGTGKTQVGKALACLLGCEFVDCDAQIERSAAQSVAEFVTARGWAEFRKRERLALLAALRRRQVVVATGGGVVERRANRRDIARSATTVVWLRAPIQILLERLANSEAPRPLLGADPQASLVALARRRQLWYGALADLEMETSQATPDIIASRIVRALATGPGSA